MQFAPDTYIGPMLALVLAGGARAARRASSFQALVFRPDPMVVTLRAEPSTRRASRSDARAGRDQAPRERPISARQERDVREPDPDPLLLVHATRAPQFVAFEGALATGSRWS
jgi:hypothetical protein